MRELDEKGECWFLAPSLLRQVAFRVWLVAVTFASLALLTTGPSPGREEPAVSDSPEAKTQDGTKCLRRQVVVGRLFASPAGLTTGWSPRHEEPAERDSHDAETQDSAKCLRREVVLGNPVG